MKYYCLQESSSDCGFCVLKVMLANLNKDANYLDLKSQKEGPYSMLDIKKLALEYKLELEGYKVDDLSLLSTFTFPLICQIKRGKDNHFVLIEKIEKGILYIFDPSIGELEINESVFQEIFNQNVLMVKNHEVEKLQVEKKKINPWLLLSLFFSGLTGIAFIVAAFFVFKVQNSIYSYISMGVIVISLLINVFINNKYVDEVYKEEQINYYNLGVVSNKIQKNLNYYGQMPLKFSIIILLCLIILESTKFGYLNLVAIAITFTLYFMFNYMYSKQTNALEMLEKSNYDLNYVLKRSKKLVMYKTLFIAIMILANAFMIMKVMNKTSLTGIDYFIFNMSLNLTIIKLLNDIAFPTNK